MVKGYDQTVKASGKMGGTLVVFEGHPSLLVGGFDFDMADLPSSDDVLPCGTYLNCDESTRKAVPVITGKVLAIDGTSVTVEDLGFGRSAFKVGATVAKLGSNLATAAENYATVASKDGNVLTLSAAVTGLAVGDILVEVDATSKKVKAIPNAILPYDRWYDPAATEVKADGMWANDMPILERRMPAANDAIKAALVAAGCQFKWSNRK